VLSLTSINKRALNIALKANKYRPHLPNKHIADAFTSTMQAAEHTKSMVTLTLLRSMIV
jgi:hypothetical protein